MSTISNIFNTGKSGLFASRTALSTTGHNISNVNTEGYSRQRVELETNPPQTKGNLIYGTGVRTKTIQRINDEYLDQQINKEGKFLAEFQEKETALSQAENIFNEIDNDGMNRLVARMFNEFRKLGNEPESEALRATVRESANQLTGDFHRVYRSLVDIQKNIDTRIDGNVRQANELVDRIGSLNQEILKLESSQGTQAPDLLDKRDVAVRHLAEIIDIAVAKNEKGQLTISIAGIGPLLSGGLTNKLYVEPSESDPASGVPDGSLRVKLKGLTAPDITDRLGGNRMNKCKIGGLLEIRNEVLARAHHRMDDMAYNIASRINAVHRMGYSLNGNTGNDFFKQPTEVYRAAEFLQLSDAVKEDVSNIATALEPDSPGDNRITQLIARLQHSKVMGNGSSTFDDYYNGTVAEIATYAQKNKSVLEHQTHIVGQLDKMRESISGVSLDEETTNLIQFQHAFDASAKVIKVADELLETVLNLKR